MKEMLKVLLILAFFVGLWGEVFPAVATAANGGKTGTAQSEPLSNGILTPLTL